MLVALVSLAFAADPVSIDGNGVTRTVACVGQQAVNVTGNNHDLTFTGDCGSVTVTGSSSTVAIDGLTRLTVVGTGNTVTWKRNLAGTKKLRQSVGFGNTITKVQ